MDVDIKLMDIKLNTDGHTYESSLTSTEVLIDFRMKADGRPQRY